MSTPTPPEKLPETILKLAREAAAADVRALPRIVPASTRSTLSSPCSC